MIELRRWVADDADDLSQAMRVSDDLSTQTGGADLSTARRARRFIDHVLAPRPGETINLAISEDGRALGNVGIGNMEHVHDSGWAYHWVSQEARGRGLASAALASVAALAFDELGLFRLELGHRIDNPAPCTVAKRAGFRTEGIERAKLRYAGKRYDVETHSRLVTDPAPDILLLPIR